MSPQGKELAWPSRELLWCALKVLTFTMEVNFSMLTQEPAQKLVQFNLRKQDDLGNSPQLPMNMTSFLKWPEGATN